MLGTMIWSHRWLRTSIQMEFNYPLPHRSSPLLRKPLACRNFCLKLSPSEVSAWIKHTEHSRRGIKISLLGNQSLRQTLHCKENVERSEHFIRYCTKILCFSESYNFFAVLSFLTSSDLKYIFFQEQKVFFFTHLYFPFYLYECIQSITNLNFK